MQALMLLLATVIFLEIDGVALLASAFGRSYEAIPLSPFWPNRSDWHQTAVVALLASAKLIEAALGLCAPVLVASLLSDIALGALERSMPQLPVHSLGISIRALATLSIVFLALAGLHAAVRSTVRVFLGLLAVVARLER